MRMRRAAGARPHLRTWRAALSGVAALLLLAGAPAAADRPSGPPHRSAAGPDSTGPVPEPFPTPESATEPVPVPVPSPEPAVATPAAAPADAPPHARPTVTSRRVRLTGEVRNVIRSGPGDRYAISAVHPRGVVFRVLAKSGDWYNVRLSDTETGWVHSALCEEFDDMGDLEFRPNPRLYTRTGSFVLNGYAGGYAFDGKSNSLVLGARLGYYMFDRLQVEAGLAWTRIHRPAQIVESLFGLTLEAEKFHLLFYSMNLTWEILPGRQMVPFVTAGGGAAIMQGGTEPAFNFGAGTTLFLSRRLATRWEVRDYRFSSGAGTSRVSNDNLEFTLGTVYLF